MAINPTRINPLDANGNVSIGVAFPLDEQNMFKGTRTIKDQLKSNLLNLLLTEPGERVMEPRFGVGLKKLLFENDINTDVLQGTIRNQIQIYTPQISLLGVRVEPDIDKHMLYIKLDYTYIIDNSVDSIQLNFLN